MRYLKRQPALSLFIVTDKLRPYMKLHDIHFKENEMTISEKDSKSQIVIPYKDIIDIWEEEDFVCILLRTGYYHKLSSDSNVRIYKHLYKYDPSGIV